MWGQSRKGTVPGENNMAKLTSYLLTEPSEHDSVLIFPGGGYHHVSVQKEGEAVAGAFNREGLNAFVLDYRVAPYTGRDILCDAVCALRQVREFPDIGPKLALMGFSAGGHLALMTAEYGKDFPNVSRETAGPDALVLCYPVVTLRDPYAHTGSRSNFLGAENAANAELIEKFSAENHIDSSFPPTFLWHCEGDASVPVQNSRMLKDELDRNGVENRFVVFEGGAHGLGLALDDAVISTWFRECVNWLHSRGFH